MATDLDGTIVRPDETISDRVVAVLRRADDAGVPVVFVTGRPPRWMGEIADRTGLHGLAICSNGAITYDLASEKVVAMRPLTVEVGLDVAQRLRAALPEVAFAVEHGDGFAREPAYVARWDSGSEVHIDGIDAIYTQPVAKLLVRHESMDPDDLLAATREIAAGLAELTHSTGDGLVEISALGVSKATTLATLCADRGVGAADVIAFGDMPNDLAMLAWAGLSYAMGDAHPDVFDVVDHRTGSVVEDGVAQVLERYFP